MCVCALLHARTVDTCYNEVASSEFCFIANYIQVHFLIWTEGFLITSFDCTVIYYVCKILLQFIIERRDRLMSLIGGLTGDSYNEMIKLRLTRVHCMYLMYL